MKRVGELIQAVTKAHPSDMFFSEFDANLLVLPQMAACYKAYNRAFLTLDEESWQILKHKAIAHFLDHRKGQLKQGFFHQLNEAFAYEFLLRKGFSSVQLVPENQTTKPDISYKHEGTQHYCEVKTIGISEEEITRRTAEKSFDCAIYCQLNEGFLHKIDYGLRKGFTQISSQGGTGLVFIVVTFDDFTWQHYREYKTQLIQFLRKHPIQEAFLKMGIHGHNGISRKSRIRERHRITQSQENKQ